MSEMPRYEFFREPETRAMIAECGFRVAEYLHEEQIGTIVLVDRAARNLHIPVRSAWQESYPDEPAPTVYFLNPDGFLSPETHGEAGYTKVVIKEQAQKSGLSSGEQHQVINNSVLRSLHALARIHRRMRDDRVANRGYFHAAELTGLADTAIRQDDRFNGSVLVLDACTHSGGSLKGIADTMRRIGISDVRTGVVSNVSNMGHDVDYIVFDNLSAPVSCRPFGPQDGIYETGGKIPTIAGTGLHPTAKQARRELHQMSQNLGKLRETYSEDRALDLRLTQTSPSLLRIIGDIIPGMQIITTEGSVEVRFDPSQLANDDEPR
jgi:hypothetical protein